MAPTTQKSYHQGVKAYEDFTDCYKLPCAWPCNPNSLAHFVEDLSLLGRSFATAKLYLAGIGAKHKLNNWPDPTDSFLIKKLLKGLSREDRGREARQPKTFDRLKQLIACLRMVCINSFETALLRAAFSLAFFGLFRISELEGQGATVPNGRAGLKRDDIPLLMPDLKIYL